MKQIYDFIRGLSPYPAAWTELQNGDKTINVKVYEAVKISGDSSAWQVGTILSDGKSEIRVAVQDGFIGIKALQVAGKKKMQIVDFMRGFKFAENARFC